VSTLDAAVRSISTRLLDVQPDDLGTTITGAVRDLCEALEVDRGYVLTTEPETLSVGILEEWWRPGVEQTPGTPIFELPIEAQRFWARNLRRGAAVFLDELNEVPPEAHEAAADLINANVLSILLVPLTSSQGTVGFTGFEARTKHHHWTDDEVALVRTVGEMLVITVDRCRAETALKRAVDDLAQRNLDLERSNRDLEQFASIVSHDLKSPLMLVEGYVDLLAAAIGNPSAAPDAEQFAAAAKRGVDRMGRLIDDLLTYARAGAGLTERQPVPLGELTHEVLVELQPLLTAAGGTIDVADLPTVRGDRSQLLQLLQNVLGNAIKFHRSGHPPTVSVTAQQHGPYWHLVVADDGIGIEPERRGEVFEMFKRGPSPDTPGTGIGLAIAARVVANHSGRTWVEENPTGGTLVCIELPVDAA
jgi:signal transduction histidine kinase